MYDTANFSVRVERQFNNLQVHFWRWNTPEGVFHHRCLL